MERGEERKQLRQEREREGELEMEGRAADQGGNYRWEGVKYSRKDSPKDQVVFFYFYFYFHGRKLLAMYRRRKVSG